MCKLFVFISGKDTILKLIHNWAFFQLPQCVGIIGGRPNHALYFCGIADNNLLYLDPHFCQDFVDLDETTTTRDKCDGYVEIKNDEFRDSTYHCPFILSTKFDRVDPSLALGFFCHTEDDYNDLAQRLRTVHFHFSKRSSLV
ncbi:unnamed protein product [Onchocerca flexuosa]|uniref:Cysteine protease n=1 Tax=Onchocerca flexuosa TaxID=387005 RepID=A0A183HVV1_9BILA|nr:unnamed protein product [Onchocerca flexuosa]